MQSIVLMGAEAVSQAGSAMRAAGNDMEHAATNISGAVEHFGRLVERLEESNRLFVDAVDRLIEESRRGR